VKIIFQAPAALVARLVDMRTSSYLPKEHSSHHTILARLLFALAAQASRQVFDGRERYYWLVWVSPGQQEQRIERKRVKN
jgi:hypothetical protein